MSSEVQPVDYQNNELKRPEQQVRVIHNVPLVKLLQPEDRENPIPHDSVSVYSIPHDAGQEYAIVFPPLNGVELYTRLLKISNSDPGIGDASSDIYTILHSDHKRRARHEEGMPGVWGAYFGSLEHQAKVFGDGKMHEYINSNIKQYQENLSLAIKTRHAIDALSGLPAIERPDLDDAKRVIKDMIEGKAPIDPALLTRFFMLSEDEVRHLKTSGRSISRNKAARLIRGQGSPDELEMFNPYVAEAGRRRATLYKDEDGNAVYNEDLLDKNILRQAKDVKGHTIIKIGEGFYNVPRNEYTLLKEGKFRKYIDIEVDDETGNIFIGDGSREKLEGAIAGIQYPDGNVKFGELAIPVVRVQEAPDGSYGFVLHDTRSAPPLPKEVIDDIKKRTDKSGKSRFASEESWISGMVGVQMLLISHPSVRSTQDDWSKIWNRTRITYSHVMGEQPKPNEPTQFNGPVQIGMIAFQALLRYQEQFIPFIENVKAVAGEGLELK
ncbi:MAG TPA: hypothetical protein VG965_03980 [Patescibacteria group bacterium]|nr:hypothetical protein [Patescibacteria group bacterium]